MSQIQTHLGYSNYSIVEQDVFTRIMKGEFLDGEEVRYDRPIDYRAAWAYVGVAKAGASILDMVWNVIRRSYDANGKCYRDQFRANIAWSDRANGWQ